MKYYRVDITIDNEYVVQVRKWHIWRLLRKYTDRSDALMHLSSLNEGNLRESEKYGIKIDAWFNKIDQWRNR